MWKDGFVRKAEIRDERWGWRFEGMKGTRVGAEAEGKFWSERYCGSGEGTVDMGNWR